MFANIFDERDLFISFPLPRSMPFFSLSDKISSHIQLSSCGAQYFFSSAILRNKSQSQIFFLYSGSRNYTEKWAKFFISQNNPNGKSIVSVCLDILRCARRKRIDTSQSHVASAEHMVIWWTGDCPHADTTQSSLHCDGKRKPQRNNNVLMLNAVAFIIAHSHFCARLHSGKFSLIRPFFFPSHLLNCCSHYTSYNDNNACIPAQLE